MPRPPPARSDAGLEDGAPGELWNLENRDAVPTAHAAYAESGARLLTNNTFGGTRPRLEMHGLGDRVGEVNRTAAQVARSVADERGLLVAGDLGPTGELLAPLGALTREDAQELFAEQLIGLVEGGIDLVLVETLSDLGEAEAALAAARKVRPSGGGDDELRHQHAHDDGCPPGRRSGASGSGGRRCRGRQLRPGPAEMEIIAAEMVRARTDDLLLIAQSNAGLPRWWETTSSTTPPPTTWPLTPAGWLSSVST